MPFELDVVGAGKVPAAKVFGIGRNYADHAREMGYVVPERQGDPVVFMKPTTCLVADGGEVVVPDDIGLVHHEGELAVVIGKGGRGITESRAMDHVLGYALFLDVTARDMQGAAKKEGKPWLASKGLDTFGPIGRVVAKENAPALENIRYDLAVNGETRQKGELSQLIFPVPFLVSWLSRRFTLERGDIIATGSPAGVGPLVPGDRVHMSGEGLEPLGVTVGRRTAIGPETP